MSKVVLISAVAASFCRCGVQFPKEGKLVSIDDFDEAQWARLKAEQMLRISEPSAAQLEAFEAGQMTEEEKADCIAAAIESLDADGFTKTGQPKVGAVRERVEFDITGKDVEPVFEALVKGGFKVPGAE